MVVQQTTVVNIPPSHTAIPIVPVYVQPVPLLSPFFPLFSSF
jgi:hypothetical protein